MVRALYCVVWCSKGRPEQKNKKKISKKSTNKKSQWSINVFPHNPPDPVSLQALVWQNHWTQISQKENETTYIPVYTQIFRLPLMCVTAEIKQSTSLKRPKYWTWRCFYHIFHYIRLGFFFFFLIIGQFSHVMPCSATSGVINMCTNTTVPSGVPQNTTSTLHSSLCIGVWIQQ